MVIGDLRPKVAASYCRTPRLASRGRNEGAQGSDTRRSAGACDFSPERFRLAERAAPRPLKDGIATPRLVVMFVSHRCPPSLPDTCNGASAKSTPRRLGSARQAYDARRAADVGVLLARGE
jgi:hypothetical protein